MFLEMWFYGGFNFFNFVDGFFDFMVCVGV